MADPIRLPNSTPKVYSRSKIAPISRQKLETRQKRQNRKSDMKRQSNDKQEKPLTVKKGSRQPLMSLSKKRGTQNTSRDKGAGTSSRRQGTVIDIHI